MKQLLFLDFESYYSTALKYDLRNVSVVEYVRDRRFHAFGMGVASADSDVEWIAHKNISKYLDMMADQIGWPNIALVGHNIKFDGFILQEIYKTMPGQYIDTKGMSKAVLGKTIIGHHLRDLAEHFGLPSKGMLETDGKIILTEAEEKALAEYCLHDVFLTREIYTHLAKEFPESQYAPMHRTVSMFVSPKLQLNVPLLEQTAKKEAERRATIFTEVGISKAEFSSNVKFPALLVSKGYEVPTKPSPRRKDEKGDPLQIPALALGDPEFLELLEGGNDELRTLCKARVAAKSTLLETRSQKLGKIGSTGLWPFDVEFSGADQTHRFSGGSGAGGNPQNFTACRDKKAHKEGHYCPGRLRTAVEAPSGCELVVGDFSNIELRLVAYLSKDPGLVQAIEQGIDIYCDFASVFYGRRITKADERERRFGKTAILGLGYGMGFLKFIKTVRVQTKETISEKDSRKAVELYRTRYSKVPALWEKLDKVIPYLVGRSDVAIDYSLNVKDLPIVVGAEWIGLPSGLKIRFPNLRQETADGEMHPEWIYDVWNKRHLEKRKLYGGKILENISQGLAGELCKEAMLQMGDGVTGLVHDEIHVVCRKGIGLVTAQKLKRVMSTSPSWMPQMKLEAEVGVGTNWSDAK